MEFPRSLAPWAHLLKIFPRELSLALGPAVHRLASAIGPMHSAVTAHIGDPDGFDDLARRGPYERLLMSEWLLADEMPDEFARRAAMGEHLFLRTARRNPAASRVSLALFDAGPNQLGAPRLAHLAALVVFTRRAEAAGAQFGWAMLQQPDAPILSGFNEAEVLRLLEARSVVEITEAQIAAWRARVADWQELDDLWFVGGERMTGWLPIGASRLEVRDIFDLEARRLALTVRGATSAAKTLTLELPDEQACARLLRDPFNVKPAAPMLPVEGAFAPLSNLVFSANGVKLFARSSYDRVIAYPVPGSPYAGTGAPKLYRMHGGEKIAAVGRIGKAICLISTKDTKASVEYYGKHPKAPVAGHYRIVHQLISFVPPAANDTLQACYSLPRAGEAAADLVFLDGGGSLFQLGDVKGYRQETGGGVVGSAWLRAANVKAIAPYHSRVLFVGKEVPNKQWVLASLGEKIDRRPLPFSGAPVGAFFGFGGSSAHETFGLVAVLESDHQATIIFAGGEFQVTTSPGERIVGVIQDVLVKWPALVVLANDQRTLMLISKDAAHQETRRNLLTAPATIQHVAVSTTAARIAYSTIEGEVVVDSLIYQKPLCRFTPRGIAS